MKYSALQDDWEEVDKNGFISPLKTNSPEQIIIFPEMIKNGTISADITPLKGSKNKWNEVGLESDILFRYSGYEGYYYAGLGAFRTKFFIGKILPGPVWQLLGSSGRRNSIKVGQTYKIKIECLGNQITFYENDVRQFVVFDEFYETGQWGLRSYRSSSKFENVMVKASKPVCFVVMPFASELDYVYDVIKNSVEERGLKCVRADEILVSRPVVEDIKERVAAADLIIVDFTNKNPNVYYEAGLADAWKKKWIVLSQSSDDLTFDVRHIRTIVYSNTMGADVQLKEKLSGAIDEVMGTSKR